MFKKKRNYLNNIYKVNPDTNAYIIEVSLDDYNEVFNGWDPSPIKRREIDPDLLNFIEQSAFDIPLKFNVELHFYVSKEVYNESKEALTKAGIINNFSFILHFIKKELRSNRKKILMYIMMSFSFLTSSQLANQYFELGLLTTTIAEGLFIGGWVFLWEAFSIFFFSSQETNSRYKRYIRFLDSPINFYYRE
ncbi:MAG: hypothetical protein K0Q49_1342 [Haloplasmataceae bacterium]|jgi:hypothetical protein|nr:hypothetical protein [Haloplasmataceae bacterium]